MAKKKKNKYKVNIRLNLPPNKVFKSVRDYNRKEDRIQLKKELKDESGRKEEV